MTDIANLGFNVDTSDLKDGRVALEALVPAAKKAESATERLEKQFTDTAGAAAKASRGASNAGAAMNAAASGANANAAAAGRSAAAMNSVNAAASAAAPSVVRMAEGYDVLTGKMNSNFLAINNNIKRMMDMSRGADDVGKSLKFTAREGLNFSRQLSDIGVTAAMGMNPLMIALQQGPQLFDIIQEKAIASGTTIGAVFRAAGVAIWTALAPLLPIILGIAVAIGAVAAAFGLATREINKGSGDIAKGLGLTEKQMERLKKKGVETGVTIGDTFFAFFDVIGDRLQSAFAGPLKWLEKAWNDTLDFIVKYGTIAIKMVVGGFVGGVYAIKKAWSLLPAAIGDVAIQAANGTIAIIEGMINKVVDLINVVLVPVDAIAKRFGFEGIGALAHADLGRISNGLAGSAKAAGAAIAEGFAEGMSDVDKGFDSIMADTAKRARQRATKRILEGAGDPGAGGRQGGKTQAELFNDLVKGANADIAAQRARADAVKLSAEAAETLEYKVKLLNEAESKGIKLTDAMRQTIDQLAAAYGKAKVEADNAIALKGVLASSDEELARLKKEGELIGVYGRQLAYAAAMANLLAQAKDKMTPEAIAAAMPQFEAAAGKIADQSVANDRAQFMEQTQRSSAERITSLKEELSYLGMTTDQVERLRIENELLASARQANINLTPADIAALKGVAAEQAELEKRLRNTREMIDFAKDTAKGFFSDMTRGLREGKSLWDSFADAAINALNKIIDKLIEAAITEGINQLFSSIGFGFSSGDVFGGGGGGKDIGNSVKMFAEGSAFTNGVFDQPTMFAYGGSNLGIMGEAGPEAVMPLERGPDGSLGVQMYGGNNMQRGPISNHIEMKSYYTLSGALTSADIMNLVKQSSAQTETSVKRNLEAWLQQLQHDGTFTR